MNDNAATSDGSPVIDPTKNVLDLVTAAIKRQDDLRNMADKHVAEIASLRAEYDEKLRKAETARIDAIRSVDVNAVNRAAEVSTQQATTLAVQVANSAETLRNQVAAAATAATVALEAALDPIKTDIADLRRAQYEAQGVKANVVDNRQNTGQIIAIIGLALAVAGLLIGLLLK